MLILCPPITTIVPYANSLDSDEMPINLASHSYPRCLTLGQHFHQLWATLKLCYVMLWILCMALDPLKFYPHMKFHFNRISWNWVIAFGQKKCDGTEKVWRTDGQTDGQMDGWTDGRTDRQTTEKWSLSVTSAYSRWHKKPSRFLRFRKSDDI